MNSFHYVNIQKLCFCKKKRRPTLLIEENGEGEVAELPGRNVCVSSFFALSSAFYCSAPESGREGGKSRAEMLLSLLAILLLHLFNVLSFLSPIPPYSFFTNGKTILGPCQC